MTWIALVAVLLLDVVTATAQDPMNRIEVRPGDWRPRPPATVPTAFPPEQLMHHLQDAMDDQETRQRLLAVDPALWSRLPPPAVLILADSFTRSGQVRKASRLYAQVLKQAEPQQVWAQAARSGLAWTAVARGDLEGVRRHFAEGSDGRTSNLSRVLVALLEAAAARTGAAETLARLAHDTSLDPTLREVATLGVGYAHLWAERYDAASSSFGAVPDGRFSDDAAYGAAWARHVAGDDDAARAALETLAQTAPTRHRRLSRRLIRLEPAAVLRAGLQRYRELHVATDEAWLAEMLDGDGAQLARAALRLIYPRPVAEPSVGADAAPARRAPGVVAPPVEARSKTRAPDANRRVSGDGGTSRRLVLVGALIVLALVGVALTVRRTPPMRR
jgi:hypothetical protein